MPRKKSTNPEAILTHFVRTRVTEKVYLRLDKISRNSDCHSVGGVARKILSQEKITLFYKDMTLNAAMEELALIRKELRAIGVNINQITRSFNQDKTENKRTFYVLKAADHYQKIDTKVDELLIIISKLAGKWLQE
jgi:hypothetical protein